MWWSIRCKHALVGGMVGGAVLLRRGVHILAGLMGGIRLIGTSFGVEVVSEGAGRAIACGRWGFEHWREEASERVVPYLLGTRSKRLPDCVSGSLVCVGVSV